ncbi:MAG: Uma2 family endonuclease [Chloroflexota bacterium]
MKVGTQATIEDLEKVPGKAEIVNGEIVHMAATGGFPGYAGDEIYASLRTYARRKKWGIAVSDNKAFIVDLPNRRSFSPDAGFYVGEMTARFYKGAPLFAVEVRSEGDYAAKAEREISAKIRAYFAAGTQVVWDVDVLGGADVVKAYRHDDPDNPVVYRRGDIANAESALPGWTMFVDDLFWPGTWKEADKESD